MKMNGRNDRVPTFALYKQGRIGGMVSFRSLRGLLAGFLCAAGLALPLAHPATAGQVIPGMTAQLEVPTVVVREGEEAVIYISLSRSFGFPVRYAYRTKDDTARAGKDYVAKSGHVVFRPGRRFAEIRVRTLTDAHIDNEYFKVVLSNPETRGYDMNVWSDYWRIEGLPATRTGYVRIRNVMPPR